MRLILIRHAESQGNAEGRFQGRVDYPLSERGLGQAVRVADRLRIEPPDVLYASPLLRAMRTAEIIGEATGLTPIPLPAVSEYDFGHLSGLRWSEIREQHPELAAAQRVHTGDFPNWPGEEGRADFQRRVCEALFALEEQHRDQSVAVCLHAGPVLVFCMTALGMPYRRPVPFACDNASITVADVQDGGATLLTVNNTCHLSD